jgi:sialic acid synthase SpsE
LRAVRSALGVPGKEPAAIELNNQQAIRKGIVAARDLAIGTVLQRDDIMFARPATEFSSNDLARVLGSKTVRAIRKGTVIARDSVQLNH